MVRTRMMVVGGNKLQPHVPRGRELLVSPPSPGVGETRNSFRALDRKRVKAQRKAILKAHARELVEAEMARAAAEKSFKQGRGAVRALGNLVKNGAKISFRGIDHDAAAEILDQRMAAFVEE